MNLIRAFVFNLERLDILRDSVGHLSKKLLSFEFARILCFVILSVSIYYETQSDIRVNSYCGLHLLWASIFNFERLDLLWYSIGHPRKMLLSFDFRKSFYFKFRATRYSSGLNRTSKKKVIVVWIWYELLFSIWSVSIYYGTQSESRLKSYCRLNLVQASIFNFESLDILQDSIGHLSINYCHLILLRASVFNFERLDILRDSIVHPSKKLLSFEFAQSFGIQFRASR